MSPAPLAVITGANRGLGLELTRQLTARGYAVIAGCRSPGHADELRRAGPLAVVRVDTTEAASIAAFGREVAGIAAGWPVAVLVNNAGVGRSGAPSGPTTHPLAALDGETLLGVLRVNTVGPVLVTQAIAPLLGPGSRVVMMSSRLGSMTENFGHDLGYNTSKAALNMATVVLAKELGERGVVCVTVHPGWVRTDMGGPAATLSAAEAMGPLADLIDRLGPEHNGRFVDWLGRPMPW